MQATGEAVVQGLMGAAITVTTQKMIQFPERNILALTIMSCLYFSDYMKEKCLACLSFT